MRAWRRINGLDTSTISYRYRNLLEREVEMFKQVELPANRRIFIINGMIKL